MDDTFGERVTRAITLLFAGVMVLGIAFVGVSAFGWWYVHRDAVNTNQALCTFRSDLERRYDAGTEFLVDNPDGIPGLPAETLQQSLNNQRRTLDSLASLDCP